MNEGAGFGRKPTLAQARDLAAERALSDALAQALRDAADLLATRGYTVTSWTPVLSRYDAARKVTP